MRGVNSVTFGVLLCLPLTLNAQVKPSAAIPLTAPTQSVSNLPSAQPQVSGSATGGSRVVWNDVTLTVDGGGDNLRNILRQVARVTGMKVTGGVPDERVFGSYGPGTVQGVLGSLFDGLSVNLLLINSGPNKPKEMVLTARTGGPTPPSPTQALNQVEEIPATPLQNQEPRPGAHSSPAGFVPGSRQDPRMRMPPGGVTDVAPAAPPDSNATGTATGTGTATDANGQPESPNGVRTPEQIFDELQRRQRGQDPAR